MCGKYNEYTGIPLQQIIITEEDGALHQSGRADIVNRQELKKGEENYFHVKCHLCLKSTAHQKEEKAINVNFSNTSS